MSPTQTMSSIQSAISSRVDALAKKPLFQKLDQSSDIDALRAIAPHGHFYVLGFQDMLRLAHSTITDPTMRAMAFSLQQGDAGHDKWFLSDMEKLGTPRDVAWLFGAEHQPVRDMTYQLVSEILSARTDANRMVFPLILEAAASVFFAAMVNLVRRAGFDKSLSYFAPLHEDAEQAHDIFTDGSQDQLNSIEFEPRAFDEALAAVDRCFECFEQFAEHLNQQSCA